MSAELARLGQIQVRMSELRGSFSTVFMGWHKTWTTQYLHCVDREGMPHTKAQKWADQQTFILREALEDLKAEIAGLEEEQSHLRLLVAHSNPA